MADENHQRKRVKFDAGVEFALAEMDKVISNINEGLLAKLSGKVSQADLETMKKGFEASVNKAQETVREIVSALEKKFDQAKAEAGETISQLTESLNSKASLAIVSQLSSLFSTQAVTIQNFNTVLTSIMSKLDGLKNAVVVGFAKLDADALAGADTDYEETVSAQLV